MVAGSNPARLTILLIDSEWFLVAPWSYPTHRVTVDPAIHTALACGYGHIPVGAAQKGLAGMNSEYRALVTGKCFESAIKLCNLTILSPGALDVYVPASPFPPTSCPPTSHVIYDRPREYRG